MSIKKSNNTSSSVFAQCDINAYSLFKFHVLEVQYKDKLKVMLQAHTDKFIVLSMPTIEYMIQKKFFTFQQINDWWEQDLDKNHRKFYLFTSASVIDLVKNKKFSYNDLDQLYQENSFLCEQILSADTIYMVKSDYISFKQIKAISEASRTKIMSIFNADTLFYIKEGYIKFDQFSKLYDDFLYQFEPIIWKYSIYASYINDSDYSEAKTKYMNDPCKFQQYIMQQDFEEIEKRVTLKKAKYANKYDSEYDNARYDNDICALENGNCEIDDNNALVENIIRVGY